MMLRQRRRRTGTRIRQAVNEALRTELTAVETTDAQREPYRAESLDLGRCRLPSLDDAAEALALAEGEDYA